MFLSSCYPLSPDWAVHTESPGKYFRGDSEICNFGFLLARSAWDISDSCQVILIDTGDQKKTVLKVMLQLLLYQQHCFQSLFYLSSSRDEFWAVLRRSMLILGCPCGMFVSQSISVSKLSFSKNTRRLCKSLIFRLLSLWCHGAARGMWCNCPEELLRICFIVVLVEVQPKDQSSLCGATA